MKDVGKFVMKVMLSVALTVAITVLSCGLYQYFKNKRS